MSRLGGCGGLHWLVHKLHHVWGCIWKSQIGLKNHMKRLFLQTVDWRFSFSPTFFVCSPIVLSLLVLIAWGDLHSPVWWSVRCKKSQVCNGSSSKRGFHVPRVSHPEQSEIGALELASYIHYSWSSIKQPPLLSGSSHPNESSPIVVPSIKWDQVLDTISLVSF